MPLENRVPPFQIPFRHVCNLIQIADGDVDKAIAALAAPASGSTSTGSGSPAPEQIPALRSRALCAKYWVENCAPEEFRFRLRKPGEKAELNGAEEAAIRLLRDEVVSRIETFTEDKPCAEAVYAIAEKTGIDSKSLFRAAYQALIGKDQGPRLANFLRSIDKQQLLRILNVY
jgi:lysyl-tRNA synthetase class 1